MLCCIKLIDAMYRSKIKKMSSKIDTSAGFIFKESSADLSTDTNNDFNLVKAKYSSDGTWVF